jgi:hypothetical protein
MSLYAIASPLSNCRIQRNPLVVRKCALSRVWLVKQITGNSFAGLGLICVHCHTILLATYMGKIIDARKSEKGHITCIYDPPGGYESFMSVLNCIYTVGCRELGRETSCINI